MTVNTAYLIFGTGTAATATGYTAGQLLIAGAVFTGVSLVVTSALIPKPDMSGVGGNLNQNIDSIANAELVYGRIRKSGTKTYHETTGDGKFYHYFITLAMHEVEEIGDIYINDEVATLDSDGFVTSQNWGSVGSDENGNPVTDSKILVKKFTGTSTQNIHSSLNASGISNMPSNYTNTFKGQGVACLYVRLEYDQDVFQSGMPLVTAVVKGKKVYDPRKDSTSTAYDSSLGVSTQRTATPSTWQYSSNPALAIRDYITSDQGVAADQDQVDDVMIAQAADDCASTGVSGAQQNSFEVGGAVSTGESKISNLNELITTLNGSLYWAQGKFRLVAGAYRNPAFSDALTYDDVRSPISIQTRFSRRDLVNTVRGTFIDEDNRWISDEYPEQQLDDMSEDNNIESVIDLPFKLVTKSAAAQRIAKQVLYTSREQIVVTAKFSTKAYQLQVGDTVKLTMDRYGWTDKEFQVKSWKATGGEGSPIEVDLTLQETSQEAYYWSQNSDEYSAITSNNTSLDDIYDGLTINTLNASFGTPVLQTDGTVSNNIGVSWSEPANGQVVKYEIGFKTSGATNYQTSITEDRTFLIDQAVVGQIYNIRVRAITSRGNKSGTYKQTTTAALTGDTSAPTVPVYSTFTVTGGYKQVVVNWVNPPEADLRYVEVARVSGSTTTVIGNSSGTAFVDSGRDDDTQYTYKIRAVDFSDNQSAYTSTKNATTVSAVAGPNGFTSAQVFLYAAGTSAPSNPTGTFTYTYATGVISGGTLGSWSTSVPTLSTGQYLWVKGAVAYSNTSTDTIPASEFSTAVKTSFSGANGTNGGVSATVTVYKATTTTSVPATPTTTTTYTFATGALTSPNNSWTKSAPSITSGQYLWACTALAFGTGSTDTIVSSDWSTATIVGIAGGTGDRGAGSWQINLAPSAMPAISATSSEINTLFTGSSGIGAAAVDKDRAFFTNTTTGEQRVWAYTESNAPNTWAYQAQVIDGNLLVDGTLTADMISSGILDASLVQIDNLTITDTLRLSAGGAGFIGGRDSQSAYNTNGFFIARTDKGGGSLGYETSFTSAFLQNGTTRISGVIAKDEEQCKVFNPLFFAGGSTAGGTSTISPDSTNAYINLGNIDEVTITAYGGGGAGGFGQDDHYQPAGTRNVSGGNTVVVLRRGSTTGTQIGSTITANGGLGGLNANGHGTNAEAGQSSDFGAGGTAGARNNSGGSSASTSYSAGGGGGGGDSSGLFDSLGGAGGGGKRGEVVTVTIDLSSETVDTFIVVTTFGSGGVSTGGDYSGGNGSQGAMTYTSILGNTTQYSMENIVPALVTSANGAYSTMTSNVGTAAVGALIAAKTNDFPLVRFEGNITVIDVGDQQQSVYSVRAVYKPM